MFFYMWCKYSMNSKATNFKIKTRHLSLQFSIEPAAFELLWKSKFRSIKHQSNVWRNLESWLIEPRWNGSQNLNIISCLCCFFTDCPSIPQYLEDNYSLGCPTFGFQPVLYFQWQEDEKPFVYTFNLPLQWSHIPLTYRWS